MNNSVAKPGQAETSVEDAVSETAESKPSQNDVDKELISDLLDSIQGLC